MDSTIYSYFGPFEEIPICGETIWTIDMFETSPPPLLDMSNWINNNNNNINNQFEHNYSYYLELGNGDYIQSKQESIESTQQSISSSNQSVGKSVNRMRFPFKLWNLVNNCDTNAIQWSSNGDSILINYKLFGEQYLNNSSYFKTQNIHSFIRQLNLYGFYKVSQRSKKNKLFIDSALYEFHEFKNNFFKRNREELLPNVFRRYSKKILKN
jgi:hypothetical protein